MAVMMTFSPVFDDDNDRAQVIIWFMVTIITFAVIFAVNSSIHSFLVVNYASSDKLAVSVGFYYMSNALGRLLGTIGSGLLYTYVGENEGEYSGSDAVAGLAACFLAGTISSLLAAVITIGIDDNKEGLQCGPCLTLVAADEKVDYYGGSEDAHGSSGTDPTAGGHSVDKTGQP